MRNLITVKNSKYPKVNSYLDLYYGIYKDILNWDYYDCKNLVYLIIDKSKENSFKLLNKLFTKSKFNKLSLLYFLFLFMAFVIVKDIIGLF